jgi:hypothetical protein
LIEEKPEVRKAGGVYYTPQYIVDYIVKETVGKKIEELAKQFESKASPPLAEGLVGAVAKLKIVDPACGSGSFLIGAYQFLLNWHHQYYKPEFERLSAIAASNEYNSKQRNDAVKERSKLPLTPDGALTTTLKKQILLNNIYGVDIDTQAVEVTKLSLLLKCLEGETQSSINAEMRFGERILPTLESNIKSGNSLIDLDFYDGQFDFTPGAEKKIKPFSWEKAFPNVFSSSLGSTDQSGFDAVIGNPPYGALFGQNELDYFKQNFETSIWRGESYLLFAEKGLKLLKIQGLLGYIIPDTLLNLGFTQSLRDFLLQNSAIQEVVGLPSKVFSGATVDTILLLTQKRNQVGTYNATEITVNVFNKKESINLIANPYKTFKVNSKEWFLQKKFNLQSGALENSLITKMESTKKNISDIAEMYSGIKTYEVGKGIPKQTEQTREIRPFTSNKKLNGWNPFYDGKDVGRYKLLWNENNFIHYGKWLAAPRSAENFEGEKILIRKIIGKTLIATYLPTLAYCNTLLFILKLKDESYSYKTILGILSSNLIGWYFRKKFQITDEDTFPQIMIRDILQFPVPAFNNSRFQELTKFVDNILILQKEKQQTTLPEKLEQLQHRINYTDDKINKLVYELYGLTEEEIEIVENSK